MKKIFYFFFMIAFFIFPNICFSQIIGPDTICVNSPATFSSGTLGKAYTWILDTVDLEVSPSLPETTVFSASSLNQENFMALTNDNGTWYGLTASYFNNPTLTEISFGNSLDNTPTAVDTIQIAGLTNPEDVNIIKANGNFYGFVISRQKLTRLDFGNSMTNTPTSTTILNDATMGWPHQLNIKKIGTDYIGFIGDRNGHIFRLEFGSSITNTPTINLLTPTGGSYQDVCNFALYKQGANWYLLATNLTTNSGVFRLDLGPNIENNNPAYTFLGTPTSNSFSITRSIVILTDCNQLYALAENETGELFKLDFHNDITSMPTITYAGTLSTSGKYNGFNVYTNNHKIKMFVADWQENSIKKVTLTDLPSSSTTIYNTNTFTHTFTATGIYHLTLYVDQGGFMGPAAYCKDVVVVNNAGNAISASDTTLCPGDTLELNATNSNATGYLWNTGATTPVIYVHQPGEYWVHLDGNLCNADDTINITEQEDPQLNLGKDTSICKDAKLLLDATTEGATGYTWNTGETTPTINVDTPGQYWVQLNGDFCSPISDTINVGLMDAPTINLGPDTTICLGTKLTLKVTKFDGADYLWSTGQKNRSIIVDNSGSYWVKVKIPGCDPAGDTISVTALSCDCTVGIPNAFSPNGDGKNDVFKPVIGNNCIFQRYELLIYNRYGQAVFRSFEPEDGWDGTTFGQPSDMGVYMYYIRYTETANEQTTIKKGDITLIR